MASRREFFRSLNPVAAMEDSRREPPKLRPPYGVDESLFQSRCTECEKHECVSACEEQIIVIEADGTPVLDFSKSGCTFCEECAHACPHGVLDLQEGSRRIGARFVIETQACMAHHGSICFACKEPCLEEAILFTGLFNPVIDDEKCTGCGFCLSRCPTLAIDFRIGTPESMQAL